jgi:hypothetical protein
MFAGRLAPIRITSCVVAVLQFARGAVGRAADRLPDDFERDEVGKMIIPVRDVDSETN